MPFDHTTSPKPGEPFDFHPQFPEPTQTAPKVAVAKKSKSTPEERVDPRQIDILDFIDYIQHSDDLIEFLLPYSDQLNWIRGYIRSINKLPCYDKVTHRFLSHLAGNFGFALIDMPFAKEVERRKLVREIVPLYKRRGTLWAIRRIIELLGFTVDFEECYRVTGIWNHHKFWDPSQIAKTERIFDWNDGTMQGWTNQLYGNFHPVAGKLRGVGEVPWPFDIRQCAIIEDTNIDYNLTVKYNLIKVWSGNPDFGVILRWQDDDNLIWARLGNYSITIIEVIDGAWWAIAQVVGLDMGLYDGEHKFFAWDDGKELVVGFDNTTAIKVAYSSSIQAIKKGLWVNGFTIVDFDDFTIRTIDTKKQPRFFAPDIFDKTLKISLSGTPSHIDAKKEYLQKIIPGFVPLDTIVKWV